MGLREVVVVRMGETVVVRAGWIDSRGEEGGQIKLKCYNPIKSNEVSG